MRGLNSRTEEPEARSDAPGVAARKRAAVELIRGHATVLQATARRYSICADDAEDAYQRGIEILLAKAPTTDRAQLVPWARTVIKHEALAIRRARERLLGAPPTAGPAAEEEDWVQLIPSTAEGPDDRAVAREKVARSREALGQLKPAELRALTLLAEGYSYAEIGAMNDWTRTKVNRCLAEGRQRFRSVFAESEAGERCPRFEPLLSACCDGELDQARLVELEDHLAACGHCRATLRTYRAAPRAAAALAPALPGAPTLWERLQELALSVQARLQGVVGGDGSGAGALSAGGARGAGAAVIAKAAALCAGTAGTAAVCVATGVLPAPAVAPRDGHRDGVERVERNLRPTGPARPPVEDVRPGPSPAAAAPQGADRPAKSAPNRRGQDPGPAPAPEPTPTESEFTPEAAGTPVPATAAPPPPASGPPSGSGSGSNGVPLGGGGGEFGP